MKIINRQEKKDWIIDYVMENGSFTFNDLDIFICFQKKFYNDIDMNILDNRYVAERHFKILTEELVGEYRLIKDKITYYNHDYNRTITSNLYNVGGVKR